MNSAPVKITYLDNAALDHCSYFLTGLLDNAAQYGYRLEIQKNGYEKHFPGLPPELARANPIFYAEDGDDAYYFCFDGYDMADRIAIEILEKVRFFFKTNYDAASVEKVVEDPLLRQRVIPSHPFFNVKLPFFLRFQHASTPLYRTVMDEFSSWKHLRHWGGYWRRSDTIDYLRGLRTDHKQHDVYFVVPYYPKFHHTSNEFRYEIMARFTEAKGINAKVGFYAPEVPGKFAKFYTKRTSRSEHLQNIAGSRISIYARGPHDCLSFKLGEQLCLGSVVVGQPIRRTKELLGGLPEFDIQYAHETPAEIVEAAIELLNNPQRLEAVRQSNMATFDKYICPSALIGRALNFMFARELNSTANGQIAREQLSS